MRLTWGFCFLMLPVTQYATTFADICIVQCNSATWGPSWLPTKAFHAQILSCSRGKKIHHCEIKSGCENPGYEASYLRSVMVVIIFYLIK